MTQSDSLQTKINYLQHKRQNVTMEVCVKGKLGSYFPEERIAPVCPPTKIWSCSRSWGQTQALLPQLCFLSFLLEFAEFRYLFPEPPSSFWWIISNSRVYWKLQSDGGGAATFSHPYHGMRDTSEGRSLTGLVRDSQAEFHNGVVSQGHRMPDYVTP